MTSREQPAVRSRRRLTPTVGLALLVVLAGLVVTFWRPFAADLPPVTTDLDRLAPDVREAIAEYRQPRVAAVLALRVVAVAVPLLFVLTRRGRRLVDRVVGHHHDRWRGPARGAAVAAVITLAGVLVGLPIRVWAGILQDGAWQVRTADAAAWWARLATGVVVDLVVVALVAAAVVWLVRRRPGSWPTDLVLGGVALLALTTMLWPVAVLPLTTPVAPLGQTPAEQAVRRTVREAGVGDLPVVVAERSRHDVRTNALVTGLGPTRRMVVDDTLLRRPDDEVVAVVAHELAHQQHRDVERAIVGSAALVLVLAMAFRPVWDHVRRREARQGRPLAVDDPRILVVGLAVMAVLAPVVEPVALWQSRRVEAAADAAAHELGASPSTTIRLQRRLAIDNLSMLHPPTWQVVLWSSHPPGAARIRDAVARAERDGLPLPSRSELVEREAADPPAWSRPS